MNRRRFLALGAVASGMFAAGGLSRMGSRPVAAAASAPPTVDRLVLTNVVDNLYDVFARGGRLDTVTVERTPLGKTPLLAEHGLAYHIDSSRGGERRQILPRSFGRGLDGPLRTSPRNSLRRRSRRSNSPGLATSPGAARQNLTRRPGGA